MIRHLYSGTLKLEYQGFKTISPVKNEVRSLKVFTKSKIWSHSSTDSQLHTTPRCKSERDFSDIFSDESKQKLINTINSMKCKEKSTAKRDAAVLVPLCRVNGSPSVLLTVRSSGLGRNKGDVSFPGGMSEVADKDLVASALRETEEEIGIPQKSIQVWSKMFSVVYSRGTLKVTPVIALIEDFNMEDCAIDKDEVEEVFSLSIESLCDPKNFHFTEFKSGYVLPVYLVGQHRVWGLTAGILHHFLKIFLPDVYKNNMPRVTKAPKQKLKS